MNIREYAAQFSISIFTQNMDLGTRLKHVLSQAGYENHYFADIDQQMISHEQSPPHIIIFDVQSSLIAPHEYLEKNLSISKEIIFIFLCQSEQMVSFKSYKKFNVSSVFNVNETYIDQQVLMSVDNLCENIFRKYQNEQLSDELEEQKKQFFALKETLDHERQAPQVRPYQLRIAEYKTAVSKEELLNTFYRQTPNQSWIYLKYVPSIETFICVSFSEVPESWIEGLSYKVSAKEQNFMEQLLVGSMPANLSQYLKGKLQTDQFKFLPMIIRDKIEGLLITPQDISAEVAEDFSLMSLVYTLHVYDSEPKQLDIEDRLTGFYNQIFYSRVLDREVDRSRRMLAPLSVVKISVDKFSELEISQGRGVADQIILSVSQVIKSTSRLNDYLCRTGENEFSLILINCHRKGAAIRSERLRVLLAKENIVKGGVQITVSQGISEYPTLTLTASDLDQSAARALDFISQKGGDKICFYKPKVEHKPDFIVST